MTLDNGITGLPILALAVAALLAVGAFAARRRPAPAHAGEEAGQGFSPTDDRDLLAQSHSARLSSLGEHAVSIAHELHQPLHFIRMTAEGIKMLDLRDGQVADRDMLERKLDNIIEQIDRMNEILAQVRVMGRRDPHGAAPFKVCDALRNARKVAEPQLRSRGIVLHTRCDLATEPLVAGRQILFEQVLTNLLTNARQAIEESRRDKPEAPGHGNIWVECACGGGLFTMAISDDGPGFSEGSTESAFEPFATTKAPGEGTGLGLYLCRRIIGAMGGAIRAESRGIPGARILIELPLNTTTRGEDTDGYRSG